MSDQVPEMPFDEWYAGFMEVEGAYLSTHELMRAAYERGRDYERYIQALDDEWSAGE
jgi:hypothetical protein